MIGSKFFIAMFVVAMYPYIVQASAEQRAIKQVLRAVAKTNKVRKLRHDLEELLYIDQIPKDIKRLAPVLDVIINKRVEFKWKF